jgi:type VI secretion system secreted protein Hcp
MAFEGYVRCEFNKQGASKGESPKKERKDWVEVRSFNFGIISPRDAGSGLPSGKRHFAPVRFLKAWGAATPQFLTAAARNEVIDHAWFEFVKVNSTGSEVVYQTVTLTNAAVSEVSQFTGDESTIGGATMKSASEIGALDLEWISLTFQRIEVESKDGKTLFADDWNTIA